MIRFTDFAAARSWGKLHTDGPTSLVVLDVDGCREDVFTAIPRGNLSWVSSARTIGAIYPFARLGRFGF